VKLETYVVPLLLAFLAACAPGSGSPLGDRAEEAPAGGAERGPVTADREVERPTPPPPDGGTVCHRMGRRFWEFAERHPGDVPGFMAALQEEFIGGTDDPFEIKRGLSEGGWNQEYFYAGHGGFRAEYDDAGRYPTGGNHQPGHFVSILTMAVRFGEEQARVAMAVAGDFEPADEDDRRLSERAIEWGTAISAGELTPRGVALRVRELCR
jgi:hypothetical protein